MKKEVSNHKGRQKGSVNKTTSDIRALMSEILMYGLSKGIEKIDSMSNYDYIAYMTLLAKHTVPVPKEDNADGTTETHIKFTGKLLQ